MDYSIFNNWPLVRDKEHLEIRQDPYEPEGYGLHLKENNKILLLERGCLEDISKMNDIGIVISIIEKSLPMIEKDGRFFDGSTISCRDIISVAKEIYRD